nr:ABC transporter permease [Gammaproteobacteria bacterium]
VSVVSTSRARQIYDATMLHALGARVGAIRSSLSLEYALIALLVSIFAIALGSVIAFGLLEYRLRLQAEGIWWTGPAVALLVSVASLGLGARHLLRRLRLVPAELLRANG